MNILNIRQQLEEQEDKILASYSLKNKFSKGRSSGKKDKYRLDFARDRDRIIHTKAFRRLKGKTQVFVAHHGDHFRSRLSHSLEVAQIARTFARIFRVNEDVVEAVALAHDLGHTPFGHAGQEILAKKIRKFFPETGKTFEHNAQSRRILEVLEPQNLCEETLLCLYKHPTNKEKHALEISGKLFPQNFLEGQIVDCADEIAYLCADLEDGLRAGILEKNDFDFVPENSIDFFVRDIAEQGLKKLEKIQQNSEKCTSPDDIRNFPEEILKYSSEVLKIKTRLKKDLFTKMYHHPVVLVQTKKGEKIISEIFDFLLQNPEKIPANFTKISPEISQQICDFISGMTDQFAENFWKNNVGA